MGQKRKQALFVALLLAGCLGAILLVFGLLKGPGGPFGMREPSTPSSVSAPPAPPRAPPAAPAPRLPVLPPAAPEPTEETPAVVAPEPTPLPSGEAGDEEEPDPVFSGEAARLTLELISPPAEEDRTIQARVIDATGAPLPGALVVFREGRVIVWRQRADAAGVVLFKPYPDEKGPFRVDALAHGFVPGSAPAVAAGADTELVLVARPVVVGEIVGLEGVKGVVKLYSAARDLTTPIGRDGTFRFDDLDAGQVTVQAEVEAYGTATETFYLEAGTSRFVRLRLRERGHARIHGRIQGWPGKGAVWINGVSAPVNPSGTYTFDHAVMGINEILIDAPERALVRERFSVISLRPSRYDFRTAAEARVRGRVRLWRTDRAVERAEVRIGFSRGDPRNDRVPLFPIQRVPVVTTDRDGGFEITRLDQRLVYLLSVVAPGTGQALLEVVPSGGFTTVRLPEGPFLYGRLQGLGGLPRDAVVTAVPLETRYPGAIFNREGWDRSKSGRDRQGFYGLAGLLPGAHHLRIEAPDFGSLETVLDLLPGQRLRLDLRLRRGVFAEDDDALLLSRLPPVVPDPMEEPVPSELTILQVDARGPTQQAPYEGVHVRFFEGDLEFAPPMEILDLEFELHGLPEATYRAVLQHPNLRKPLVHDRIVLRRGGVTAIEFR